MKAYIAYGSNMDERQMARRCPGARIIGTGVLKGWQLMYKRSRTGAYATIERKQGKVVPVVLWAVSEANERALDRYEGFPSFYYKTNIPVEEVEAAGEEKLPRTVVGMAYVMHEERKFGMPETWYQELLAEAYWHFGFDLTILDDSLVFTMKKILEKIDKICKK